MSIQKLRIAIFEEVSKAEKIHAIITSLESVVVPMTSKMLNRALNNSTSRFPDSIFENFQETDDYLEFKEKHSLGTLVPMMQYGDLVTNRDLGCCGSIDYFTARFNKWFKELKTVIGNTSDISGAGSVSGLSPLETKILLDALTNLYADIRENIRDMNTELKYIMPYKDEIEDVSKEFFELMQQAYILTAALPTEPKTLNFFSSNQTNRIVPDLNP